MGQAAFFVELKKIVDLIDLTDLFDNHPEIEHFYTAGELGPHTSPLANKFIAQTLAPLVRAACNNMA